MNLLSVQNLAKIYPTFTLQNISFSLPKGKIMGLIGRNGAGKSTTLKAMLNMVRPSSGTITMFGQSFLNNEQACKQKIGVVLGGIDFYSNKKLSDITAVTKRFYSKWDENAYQKYLQAFALLPKKRVKELSTGMKVKYMLALALSHNAELLILDEPTSGLDPVSRDELLTLFQQLVKDGNRSILFSTQITSDLEKCADSITYIKEGQLVSSTEKPAFIASFQHLKNPEEAGELTLEEILIRTERKHYDI
ncbi:ABC transporter ATP-binding protein [Ruminococcaceae bacterium OttesenSCG-928-A16]|nr:ABC transporter ATP-binding protein [Ruminococcaceae bacterium OttesenSCG-928-A16]